MLDRFAATRGRDHVVGRIPAQIYAIADENRWGIGETVEKLLEAFRARSL